jgi:hypothetical protein
MYGGAASAAVSDAGAANSEAAKSVMTFLRIVIPLYLFCLSMIFSENRYTPFRIMLYAPISLPF